jgi:ABC-type sugar transport system substrate-binding protein
MDLHLARPIALCALVTISLIATACGGTTGSSTAKPAFLGTYPGIDPAEEQIKIGFARAGTDLGVEAIFRTPPTFDVPAQYNVTQTALSYPNLKGVAVVAADPNGLEGVMKLAKTQGLVLAQAAGCTPAATAPICFDANPPALGAKAAKYLGPLMGGSGDVVVAMGPLGDVNNASREKGFADYMAQNFPNIHIVQQIYDCNAVDKSATCAQNAISAHPNMKAYYLNGNPSDGITAFATAGKHVIVAGLDNAPTLLAAVKSGTAAFTLVQPLECDGYLMLLALYLQAEKHLVSTQKYYDLGSTYIDAKNVDTLASAQNDTCNGLINDFKTNVFKPATK